MAARWLARSQAALGRGRFGGAGKNCELLVDFLEQTGALVFEQRKTDVQDELFPQI